MTMEIESNGLKVDYIVLFVTSVYKKKAARSAPPTEESSAWLLLDKDIAPSGWLEGEELGLLEEDEEVEDGEEDEVLPAYVLPSMTTVAPGPMFTPLPIPRSVE
jgi:hypothetical protein